MHGISVDAAAVWRRCACCWLSGLFDTAHLCPAALHSTTLLCFLTSLWRALNVCPRPGSASPRPAAGNRIAGVSDLQPLMALHSLRTLDLEGNPLADDKDYILRCVHREWWGSAEGEDLRWPDSAAPGWPRRHSGGECDVWAGSSRRPIRSSAPSAAHRNRCHPSHKNFLQVF